MSGFVLNYDVTLSLFSGSGPASDTAANRIMELSKKNRELTSEIEKERRKVKQLSRKHTEMEYEVVCAPSFADMPFVLIKININVWRIVQTVLR